MSNNDVVTTLSSLLSSVLSRNFNLSHMEATTVMTLISLMINYTLAKQFFNINLLNITKYIDMTIVMRIVLTTVLSIIGYKIHGQYKITHKKNQTVTIYDEHQIRVLVTYFDEILKLNRCTDYTVGDLDYHFDDYFKLFELGYKVFTPDKNCDRTIPAINEKIRFQDDSFGVSGYIIWKKITQTRDVQGRGNGAIIAKTHSIVYPELTIETMNKSIRDYQDYIVEQEDKFRNNTVCLKYFKVFGNSDADSAPYTIHDVELFKGDKVSSNELEKLFIDSFFHKEKRGLWHNIKTVIETPEIFHKMGQGAFCNYILHGPPGSGKSTFAYRVARALNLNIISIDIGSIRKKRDLYRIIQTPRDSVLKSYYVEERALIVIEELDVALKKLIDKEQKKKRMGNILEDCFDKIYFDENVTVPTKECSDEKDKSAKARYNELMLAYGDIESDYTVRDLLDILQGSLSVDGSVIIATTNNLDIIREHCPELVRDGRLTPIFFGYLDKNSLDELCMYHFGEKISVEQIQSLYEDMDVLNVPTSSILNMIKDCKIVEKSGIDSLYFKLQQRKNKDFIYAD